VVLNLAEGSGKTSTKDRCRFYEIALGSVRECQAILDLMDQADEGINATLDEVAASVFSLCRALRGGG
jgi:four helix bundle protein